MKAEFGNLEQIKLLQKEQAVRDSKAEMKRKKVYESPMQEFIDMEADLGWHYFVLNELVKRFGGKDKQSPIEAMIDNVTGYQNAELLTNYKLALRHLSAIKKLKIKLNERFDRQYDLTGEDEPIKLTKSLISKHIKLL